MEKEKKEGWLRKIQPGCYGLNLCEGKMGGGGWKNCPLPPSFF